MAIITVTEQNYEELVLKAERPVLISGHHGAVIADASYRHWKR